MLSSEQARTAVTEAITKAGGATPTSGAERLSSLNLTPDKLQNLVSNIITAVVQLQHYTNADTLGGFDDSMTVTGLTNRVMQLAVGKLCLNPTTPHPQTYPYPIQCPECGWPVK